MWTDCLLQEQMWHQAEEHLQEAEQVLPKDGLHNQRAHLYDNYARLFEAQEDRQ